VLRQGGHFAKVAVGLLAASPSAAEALASLSVAPVHVVPFFMEDGYFTRVAVPRALSAVSGPGESRPLRYCPPVGTHPGIAGLIERRVAAFCDAAGIDAAGLALVLVGHGSRRSPGRAMAAYAHAAGLARLRRFRSVSTAFLEEAPFVPDIFARLRGGGHVAVVGLFAGEGGHPRDDLPAMIRAEGHDAGVAPANLGSIGNHPEMPAIILDQARAPQPG
jgi:sirohydrochlorin cobaltochelatase